MRRWRRRAEAYYLKGVRDFAVRVQVLDQESSRLEYMGRIIRDSIRVPVRTAATPSENARQEPGILDTYLAGILEIVKESKDRIIAAREAILEDRSRFLASIRASLSPHDPTAPQNPESGGRCDGRDYDRLDGDGNVEDIRAIDLGLRHLAQNLMYLKTCRKILVGFERSGASGATTQDPLREMTYRHSEVGRAQEMAAMADHFLLLALMEFSCSRAAREHLTGCRRLLPGLAVEIIITFSGVDAGMGAFEKAIVRIGEVLEANTVMANRIAGIRSARLKPPQHRIELERGQGQR